MPTSRPVELTILHHDEGVVVVDKPPGLEATGRTPDDPGGVQHHLQRQLRRRLWAVHQLDRQTSGVLVFVRRKALVRRWQQRMRGDAGARKRYLAVVHGRVRGDRHRVEASLVYDRGRRRWVVRAGGRRAVSQVAVLDRTGPEAPVAASALEVWLETGRTHQARVHLAHLGHPLLGEERYRDPPCREHPRHALHAWSVTTADGCRFEAPIPPDLRQLARRLGLGLGSS